MRSRTYSSAATNVYRGLVRPALFAIDDPERAHEIASPLLRRSFPSSLLRNYLDHARERLSINVDGVELDGPIGLAAGFDKDAKLLAGLAQIFDYVTFGTVLPYPWPGNPRTNEEFPSSKRIVRLKERESMLNCLGFPFSGIEHVSANLDSYSGKTPLNASVAVRPPAEGESMDDVLAKFTEMLRILQRHAPHKIRTIEANFASPNTKGLAIFFEQGVFEMFAGALIGFADIPKYIKMPPHLDPSTQRRNMDVVKRWMEMGGDGISMINTVRTEDHRLTMGAGGESGSAVFYVMMENLLSYRSAFGFDITINASGGISPQRVPEVLLWGGADTVQILTPFIYYGPGYVRDAKVELLDALRINGYESLEQFRNQR